MDWQVCGLAEAQALSSSWLHSSAQEEATGASEDFLEGFFSSTAREKSWQPEAEILNWDKTVHLLL